jgi:hypothetical protein
MPRPREAKDEQTAPVAEQAEETLLPFSVIIDGQDRTVFAKDEDDLQVRIAKLRGQ